MVVVREIIMPTWSQLSLIDIQWSLRSVERLAFIRGVKAMWL